MPRPRNLEPEETLAKAMPVFWRRGYLNTSIDDLIAATGTSRHSLYGVYQNKLGLFLACLDYYQDVVVSAAFGIVERPRAALPEIGRYLTLIVDAAKAGKAGDGCLMSNTACELPSIEKGATSKVEAFRTRLRRGFATALARGIELGQVRRDISIDETADFLVGVTHGLSLMARSGARPAMMANVVKTTMSALR